jgi:uncharacterized protein (TIGR02186 family)
MKNSGLINRIAIIIMSLSLSLLLLCINNAFAELTVKANHDHIKIDSFYNGSTLSIRGVSTPADADLIIKITSAEGHQSLREKSKVGNILWMNTGELKIENVPNVYFLHSTRKIENILSKEDMNKYVLGYPSLEQHVKMNVTNEEDKTRWFNEFIKFKESSKLFDTSFGKITLKEMDGKQNYYILTQWPYQAPPGNYTVTVYAVKDKKVIETATANVLVEQVGIVKSLAQMAKNNGALYGFLSIILALGSGFGVGLVFRKSGGAH